MNHLNLGFVAFSLSSFMAFGQEITAKVFNPTDVYPATFSPELAGKPVIYDSMKPLIRKLQDPKNSDFISGGDASTNLKWRLQHFTIISGDVAAVNFTEGHVDVIGVFVRNHAKNQWELTTEVGGRFKTRVYADEPTDTK
jgi:hypothetical protein